MERQEYTVTITQDGRATVAVSGVEGPSCKAATERLEKALGVTAESTPTAEYYMTSTTTDATVRRTGD